jgi:hypothetical protein
MLSSWGAVKKPYQKICRCNGCCQLYFLYEETVHESSLHVPCMMSTYSSHGWEEYGLQRKDSEGTIPPTFEWASKPGAQIEMLCFQFMCFLKLVIFVTSPGYDVTQVRALIAYRRPSSPCGSVPTWFSRVAVLTDILHQTCQHYTMYLKYSWRHHMPFNILCECAAISNPVFTCTHIETEAWSRSS